LAASATSRDNRAGVTHPPARAVPCSAHTTFRLEDISDLVGHSSTSATEPVYRHEIRSMLTEGATAMNRNLNAKAAKLA
jgi:integrase